MRKASIARSVERAVVVGGALVFALLFLGDLSWWAILLPAWGGIWTIVRIIHQQRAAGPPAAGAGQDRPTVPSKAAAKEGSG